MSLTVTDLFCGAGGSSDGARQVGAELRLGLNHWDRAIETHAANFPEADHDCADVSALTTAQIRRYPDSDILIASPECTNHSLAKGARRRKPQASSLFEDGPAGDDEQDRSRATMWDVVRFAEQKILKGKPYKAIVVENVVDAYKWGADDSGQLFAAWLLALEGLGYRHQVVYLNSMFTGRVPQSRNRMYVVFWLAKVRQPDLRIQPLCWCPWCEDVVHGRQTWKKLTGYLSCWGSYGPQYYFTCPGCSKACIPAAPPAIDIIDSTNLGQVIGERSEDLARDTRSRIARGLTRLDSEPFTFEWTKAGAPKGRVMTVPMVHLPAEANGAISVPVAANTFERTPGNRARPAEAAPADTVHGTLDRALVVPPMGDVDPRPAHAAPGPTQTTSTRAALVMANRAHAVPSPSDERSSPAVCTGETLAVIQVQRNGTARDASAAVHTIRARGQHHAVLMRNNTARGDQGQMSTPAHEPARTITTAGHQSLVIPYQAGNQPIAAEQEPVSTLTTRDRLALVVPAGGTWDDEATRGDAPMPTQTASESRAVVWTDEEVDRCRFRMFTLDEIAGAMAMSTRHDGADYIVLGNKRERMAQLGNAVTPPAMALLIARIREALDA